MSGVLSVSLRRRRTHWGRICSQFVASRSCSIGITCVPRHGSSSLHTLHIGPSYTLQKKRSAKKSPFSSYSKLSLGELSREELLMALKKNDMDISSLTPVELTSILNTFKRESKALKHYEIVIMLRWLHYTNTRALNNDHAAFIDEYLQLVRHSIESLPLPQADAPGDQFINIKTQERDLFVNSVFGMNNLVALDSKSEGSPKYTTFLMETLATLFERKRCIQEAMNDIRQENSITPNLSKVFPEKNTSTIPLNRKSRQKIVFATSPKTPFAEYILKSFSESPVYGFYNEVNRGKYSRLPPNMLNGLKKSIDTPVRGNDLRILLNGLYYLTCDHEEVRNYAIL